MLPQSPSLPITAREIVSYSIVTRNWLTRRRERIVAAYLIADVEITDPAAMGNYVKLAGESLAPFQWNSAVSPKHRSKRLSQRQFSEQLYAIPASLASVSGPPVISSPFYLQPFARKGCHPTQGPCQNPANKRPCSGEYKALDLSVNRAIPFG